MLDSLAKRYGTLPSVVMEKGDSFDMMVYDVGMNWESIQHAKQNKQPLTEAQQRRMYGDDNLKSMEERFYGHKSND
jgi:hypothetical protein